MERIDRLPHPFDQHYLRKHTPGGHDHDQQSHAGGGGGEAGAGKELKGFPARESVRDSKTKVNPPAKWKQSVTPEEQLAIDTYTENGSSHINSVLRGGGKFDDSHYQRAADGLNALIDRAGEGEERVLYRGARIMPSGVNPPPGSAGAREPEEFVRSFEKHIGKTVRLKGFQSTSTDATAAPDFAGRPENPIFEIKSRRGAPINGLSKHPSEQEVMLGHNWKYRVLEVNRNTPFKSRSGKVQRFTVIRLEVL